MTHEDPIIRLADQHRVGVQAWMVHPFWQGRSPGCTHCAEGGPDAPCWGQVRCHGFFDGCDCPKCHAQEIELDEVVVDHNGNPVPRLEDLLA